MKTLWKLSREAIRYKGLYILAISATLCLTMVNLTAPRLLSSMTAIARAILRRSPIIVLDEATAAVDVETEQQIRSAINSLTGKRTIIAIAHRLRTIRSAEQILAIEEGEVREKDTHEQLIAQGGQYARMNEIQKKNE